MKKITVQNLREVAREIKAVERSLKRGERDYAEVNLMLDLTSETLIITNFGVDTYYEKHIETICLYGVDFVSGKKKVRNLPEIIESLKRILEERL